MPPFQRSLLVIVIVCLSGVLIECVPTKVSKTSPPQAYVSPRRKLDNAFAARSSQLAAINERTSMANLTSENLLNSEESPTHVVSSNGNFTNDDVQYTLTNEKPIEANLSSTSSEVKPFEDDPVNKETTNKSGTQSAPSNNSPSNYNQINDNLPIAQVDTFNIDQLRYSAADNIDPIIYQCMSSCTGGYLNSELRGRCCSMNFEACCGNSNPINPINPVSNLNSSPNIISNSISNTNSINANSVNPISNAPTNNVPSAQNSNVNQISSQTPSNRNASPSQVSPVQSSAAQSSPSQSSQASSTQPSSAQSSPVQSSPPQASSPSSSEFYGTKTKAKSPANKLKNPEQAVALNPPVDPLYLAALLNQNLANRDRLNLANALGLGNSMGYTNFLLPNNYQYSDQSNVQNLNGFIPIGQTNTISSPPNMISSPANVISSPANAITSPATSNSANTAGTVSSPATSLNANPINSGPNPHEMFTRKSTMNQNRFGTKTAGANSIYGSPTSQSISDLSIPQSPVEQLYGFQGRQQPTVIQNNENSAVQPGNQQVASGPQAVNGQQTSQTNSQRINNRNPNEATAPQQQQTSQGGLINSFISHIPFIGFNPIRLPGIIISGSAPSQQPPQMTANQVGQPVSPQSGQAGQGYQNLQLGGQVYGIRPESQNAQQISPNQLGEQSAVANPTQNSIQNQSPNKVISNQPSSATGQAANPGSTTFNRPVSIYNRIGSFLGRPFVWNKPNSIMYAAGNRDLPFLAEMTPEQQMQNLQTILQLYSALSYMSLQEILGQSHPHLLNQYMQGEKALKEQIREEFLRSAAKKS